MTALRKIEPRNTTVQHQVGIVDLAMAHEMQEFVAHAYILSFAHLRECRMHTAANGARNGGAGERYASRFSDARRRAP